MAIPLNYRKVRRWVGGLNNVAKPEDLQSFDGRVVSFVVDAVNVDFNDVGKPSMRRGVRLLNQGRWHSVWADDGMDYALGVRDEQLCVLTGYDDVLTIVPIAQAGVFPVSYTYFNARTYWSDGVRQGVVLPAGADASWGLPDPGGQPFVSAAASGGLEEGRYRVAVTYMDAAGTESGASESVDVVVAAGGGIQLFVPYLPEGVQDVAVYVSAASGELLYRYGLVRSGSTLIGVHTPGRLLETQFMERVPPATIVRSFNGRIYFAVGDTLGYSRPLRYGLYKPTEDYIRFPDVIRFVEAVDDGLYVGTDTLTYFLSGSDPTKFDQRVVDPVGAVRGASMRCRGSIVGEQGYQGRVAIWWSRQGRLAVGAPGGTVIFPTQDRLALPDYEQGSMLLRERDGARHIVTSFRGTRTGSGFGARDTADIEVVRNGIVVPAPSVKRAVVQQRFSVADTADAV